MSTPTTPSPQRPPGFREQFMCPTGRWGWLAGQIMARTSKPRSLFVLSQLDLQPTDRVLEVGFGSGADIRRASVIATAGFVAGIDASEAMLRMANRRNAAAIRKGCVELRRLSAGDALPWPDASFDKVFSINSYQFWPDPAAALAELCRVLKPGGRIAIAVQPLQSGATTETARQTGKALGEALIHAGFRDVHIALKALRPTPVACALGIREREAATAE